MLASFDEAEDAVQETFLRAWRGARLVRRQRARRAWLYRIATNVCLDTLRRSVAPAAPRCGPFAEVRGCSPTPTGCSTRSRRARRSRTPSSSTRETIELAFLAALQVLPPRQRAALIARDVLGWPATDTAALLDTSVAAANSALQRARATMREHLPAQRSEWSAGEPSEEERELLD